VGPTAGVIVALNLTSLGVGLLAKPLAPSDLGQRFGGTALVIVLSLFYANWIHAVMRQGRERQRLIDELREQEAEITALSAERGAAHERARIAREMHDTLAQGFTSIITLGRAVQGELGTDLALARRHVELITVTAQENLAESHRIIAALSPLRVEDRSLPQALARVAARFTAETGLDAAIEVRGPARATSPAAEVVALRVVQEALANVRKHAKAGHVNVAVEYGAGTLTVEIRDDGVGFDPAAPTAGFGLKGLRSRVLESGGAVRVFSWPGAGTTIRVTLSAGSSP
jgi:signal transduction histidine kinase